MKDILFENNSELIGVGLSTGFHQQDILIQHKGWNKFTPQLGVGILDFIDEETTSEEVKSVITYEFERDGMTVNDIAITADNKIQTNANY